MEWVDSTTFDDLSHGVRRYTCGIVERTTEVRSVVAPSVYKWEFPGTIRPHISPCNGCGANSVRIGKHGMRVCSYCGNSLEAW